MLYQKKFNKMNNIKILAILFLASVNMFADKKKDVVTISLPNKTAIEIHARDINKYEVDTAFITENINRFFKFCKTTNVEELIHQGPKDISIKVPEGKISRYTHEPVEDAFYELNISEREKPNQIVTSKNFEKTLYYLQKHQLEFENYKFTYKIGFDNLSQLEDILKPQMQKVVLELMQENYDQKSKYIENIHYKVADDFSFEKICQNERNHYYDQILLNGYTSMQNVKNSWAVSIEAAMHFAFQRKGLTKNTYSLYYEWQYDFSDTDKRNINQFLSLGYTRNFSEDPDNSNFYTFKFGYLMDKQGDLYNDDTFRLSVRRPLGKNINVEPQLYFNDFFKDVIPSIKIGIGF